MAETIINGQTCLERIGMEARRSHIMKNRWYIDSQYTKPLVMQEYAIESEYVISTAGERAEQEIMQYEADMAAKENSKALRAQKKALKREEKERKRNEKANTVKGGLKEDDLYTPKEKL